MFPSQGGCSYIDTNSLTRYSCHMKQKSEQKVRLNRQQPHAAVRVRARVHAGTLVPLELLNLPEGKEVTLTVDLKERPRPQQEQTLAEWDLGAKEPLTRDAIYGDRV